MSDPLEEVKVRHREPDDADEHHPHVEAVRAVPSGQCLEREHDQTYAGDAERDRDQQPSGATREVAQIVHGEETLGRPRGCDLAIEHDYRRVVICRARALAVAGLRRDA